MEGLMPTAEKEILRYVKKEASSDLLYLIGVACMERLAETNRAGGIKAICDAGTAALVKMTKE